MYQEYNPNPTEKRREDCVIRALTKALNVDWDTAYMKLSAKGFEVKEMPSVNWVWGTLLRDMKFTRVGLPNTCPACYTLKDFCRDNPNGTFIVATGTHVVAVVDGNYFDSWDSGDQVVTYFFRR